MVENKAQGTIDTYPFRGYSLLSPTVLNRSESGGMKEQKMLTSSQRNMKEEMRMEVKITCTTELVQGGCNACSVAPSTSYIITFDETGIPLGNLDVESLVMAIALKQGFRQELVMTFDDEIVVFNKTGKTVEMKESDGQLTYESQGKVMKVSLQLTDNEAIFAETNQVLTKIFALDPVTFITEAVEA